MILVFLVLSFNPAFSLSSFIFIKRLFISSLLSALRSEWPSGGPLSKKSTNSNFWRVCGEKGTLLHYWWECKLIQLLHIQYTIYRQYYYIQYTIQYTIYQRRQWQPTPVLLPGKSHGRRSLVGCSPWGHQESDTTEQLHFHFSLSCIGEGNGNPLQCSCLENPRDGGSWWAAISGVAQSRTQLKRFSSSSILYRDSLLYIDNMGIP